MKKIITVVQKKGGATKTTTSMNLGGVLMSLGYTVCIADMDYEQQSAYKWQKRGRDFFDVVSVVSEKQLKEYIANIKEVDFIIIDTPPEFLAASVKASLLSDLIIVPCPPSQLDLESAQETVELAETMKKEFRLLACNVKTGTTIGKEFPKTLSRVGKVFNTVIHHRISMVEAAMYGTWIGAYEPKGRGRFEYQELAREILKIMGVKKHEKKT